MSFSCGCFVVPGGKVTTEMLKHHLVHTMEAMLFWELLGRRPGRGLTLENLPINHRLSELRQSYIEVVTELYPESVQEKDQATV